MKYLTSIKHNYKLSKASRVKMAHVDLWKEPNRKRDADVSAQNQTVAAENPLLCSRRQEESLKFFGR